MDKVTIEFYTDNAAFEDVPKQNEVARILTRISNDVYDGLTENVIRDSNGNNIGKWAWKDNAVAHDAHGVVIAERKEAEFPEVVGPLLMFGDRSPLTLFRLDNGDLIVGFYPHADDYIAIADKENF